MSIYSSQEEWDILNKSLSDIFDLEYIQTIYEKPDIIEFKTIPSIMTEDMKQSISETLKLDWAENDYTERKNKLSKASKEKWKDPDFYGKMLEIRKNQWKKEENQHILLRWKQNAKSYIVYDPNGNVFHTNNLKDFCKEHNLGQSSKMYYVAKGQRNHYKGWKCRLLSE